MIEAYKILHASYRGNSLKIVNWRCQSLWFKKILLL